MSLFPGKSDHSPLHEDKVTSSSLPSLCAQCRGKINTQGNVSFFLFPNRRGVWGESPTLPFPVFFVEKLEHLAVAVDMSLALAPKKNWRDFLFFLLLAIKVFMPLFFSPPFSKHLSRKSRSKRRPTTTTTTINMSTDV